MLALIMRVLYIDVKSENQTCLMARAQLLNEIDACKLGGFKLLKVVHGYGSHGVGGLIKKELQTTFQMLKRHKKIFDYIPCEKWTPTNPLRKKAVELSSELLSDSDLMYLNPGVTIVLI